VKVLHVIPSVAPRDGGPSRAVVEMCRALGSHGVDTLIASTDADGVGRLDVKTGQLVSYENVAAIFFAREWSEAFKYSRPLAHWLGAHVAEFDVVHIHAIFSHPCFAAAAACRKQGVPYVVRPLGTLDPWSMKQKPWRKALFWQISGKRMLQAAAAVHYTARAEQSAAEKSLGVNHGWVIPLGVETKASVRTNGEEIRFDKLTDLSDPYVLVLSRLHPKKALDILLDAFVSLIQQQDFKGWRLVLAGEGPDEYVQALKDKVLAHGAEKSVLFPGWLKGDEKDAFLRGASLLALTSYQENFGMCVMEALAAGVPVLVSPHVNLADEIEGAGAGWVSPVEEGSLRETLTSALRDRDELSRRGAAGRVLARRFDWANVAGMLTQLYESVKRDETGNV
jgi:glycosyltransferase involved in cell wall biosynthesis